MRKLWIILIMAIIGISAFTHCKELLKSNFNLTVSLTPGINGAPTNGNYTYQEGEVVSYAYSLKEGYENLVILINNQSAALSGQIAMNQDYTITVKADLKKNYSVLGTWNAQINLTNGFTWGKETFIFSGTKESGTFTDSKNNSGSYTVTNEKTIKFKYKDYLDSFSGSFTSETNMEGTMTSGNNYSGTWTAAKASSSVAYIQRIIPSNSFHSSTSVKRIHTPD
jgi:hypothetical protein